MTSGRSTVLLLGYGNPGRRDDGLGPALAAALEDLHLPGVTIDSDYQLTVEDAATVAGHDVVVFADADVSGPEPFSFRRIAPGATLTFTSHSASPAGVLALADELFHTRPAAYVLGIRGYEFDEFGEALSERARANLAAAVKFMVEVLRERGFDAATGRASAAPATADPKSAAAAAPAKGAMR